MRAFEFFINKVFCIVMNKMILYRFVFTIYSHYLQPFWFPSEMHHRECVVYTFRREFIFGSSTA